MTTANKITILRILLVPFFVVELIYYIETGNEIHRLVAILSFAIAAVLDGVDGFIARHFNQKSELGAILDPLADKLLLVSGIVALSFNHGSFLGQIPLWLTGTIIGRDILILIGMVVIQLTVGKVAVQPRFTGKCATVLANGRRHLDFAEMGPGFESALGEVFDDRRGGLHRRFGTALRLGRRETAWLASGEFADKTLIFANYFGFNCGNRITSRMLSWPSSIMHKRSMPMPMPPAGGMPCSSATRKSSSSFCCSPPA